jgi:hypothetical protein
LCRFVVSGAPKIFGQVQLAGIFVLGGSQSSAGSKGSSADLAVPADRESGLAPSSRSDASRCRCPKARATRDRAHARFVFVPSGIWYTSGATGGFVAGIRAGFAYNTFPSMNGHVVPPEIMMLVPWWKNFFYNMATVQFDHRLLAWTLAFLVPVLWWKVRRVRGAPARV